VAKNVYNEGDLIYLAMPENGRVTIRPMRLVQLVSVSKDGELWKVCTHASGDVSEYFIRYSDDLDEIEPDKIVNKCYQQPHNDDVPV